MAYKIYSDGKAVSHQQAVELLREEAAGVFESMRVYNGCIFLLDEHLQRLRESAKTVGYHPIPDPESMKSTLEQTLELSNEKNTSVRLTLWDGKTYVIIGNREIQADLYKTGVVLKTASFPRGSGNAFPYQVKTASYQQAVMASTEPNPRKVFDWLFLDRGNYLTETRTANFFLVKGGSELLTSPEHLILNGVTRRFMIKCARESGFKIRETVLTRHDFFNADEAFLSNTSWEILPVKELDGREIGSKIPGTVTQKLHRIYQRRVQVSCPGK